MCRSLMGFLALSLGAALSAIFYLKYWIFLHSSQTASAFRFRDVTREKAKTPEQKTELMVFLAAWLSPPFRAA